MNYIYLRLFILGGLVLFFTKNNTLIAAQDRQWRREMIGEVIQEPEKIKSRVRDALHKYFKEPEYIKVKFFPTKKGDLASGYFTRIDVNVRNAKVKELKVEEGFFSFREITIKLFNLYRDGDLRIKDLKNTQFRFTVTEESINAAILEKKLPLKNARLAILPGQLYFRGYFKTLFFKSHVETKGRLAIKNNKHIHFYPDRLKLNSLPIPGFVKKTLSRKINPIIDLDDFNFIQSIAEINLQQGLVEFKN
ncbi:MAG: LmeA family phospholipid-binding protein [bacterium]|nr:LmeA family phospholipid-binding protein [bacterium]